VSVVERFGDEPILGAEVLVQGPLRHPGPGRAVTHFGVYTDVDAHLERLDHELDVWASRVCDGLDKAAFVQTARVDTAGRTEDYDAVAPFAASWHGLRRYWDRR
jgi:hypothetical protein